MTFHEYIREMTNKETKLNFTGLYDYVNLMNIPISFTKIKYNNLGFSSQIMVYLNENVIKYDPELIFFVILHEIGHFLSFSQSHEINSHKNTLREKDFDVFMKKIIIEENIANNFAYAHYLFLNGYEFPIPKYKFDFENEEVLAELEAQMKNYLFLKYNDDLSYEENIVNYIN